MSILCDIMKIYASVHFSIAIEPYIQMIEIIPWAAVTHSNTFTQGKLSYIYILDTYSGVVTFQPNTPFGGQENSKNKMCSFQASNINLMQKINIRFSIVRARRDGSHAWLYSVFGVNKNTNLWALGDMLYDSTNKGCSYCMNEGVQVRLVLLIS